MLYSTPLKIAFLGWRTVEHAASLFRALMERASSTFYWMPLRAHQKAEFHPMLGIIEVATYWKTQESGPCKHSVGKF